MAKHIITGTAAPVDAPTELGQHFVDTATPAIYFSTGTATVADWKLVQEAGLLGTIAIQDANNVAITGGSITNLTTLELPVSATPAVATDGEIALDTTVADFSHGVIKFYGTEEQGIVSMPIAQFTAPTDGYVVTYNATNDEFVLAAGGGAVSSVNGLTGAVSLNGGYIGIKGADIASAATADLATATGDWVDVTGTTTITALGTASAGVERLVRFTGILTLTHNGTSLILPTGANITTAAGDFARFRSLGSGNWVCVAYQRASGAPVRDPRAPSIQTVTSSATVTPTFSDDLVTITAQAAALALANPTGTAIPGLGMVIRIKDDGTARAITYDTQYRAIGITLPTTTVISKTTYLAMIYNSTDTRWDVVATGTEA